MMRTTCCSVSNRMDTHIVVSNHPPATVRGERADIITSLTFDAWLLATYGTLGDGLPDGRAWERAITDSLAHPGISRRQYAGLTELFGRGSASGCRHELDGAADGRVGRVVVEAKARADALTKADVAVFDLKTRDYYTAALPNAASDRWWRLLVSAGPVKPDLRRLCATLAVIVVEPGILPLPFLAWVAGRPSADGFFREALLREVLRLGERAVACMQERWKPDGAGGIRYDITWWKPDDLANLVWLQEELSDDVLELYERESSERLPRRAAALMERLRWRGTAL